MGKRRPRGRVRRAGKRQRSDPAHRSYVVGCVLEELVREVEAAAMLVPPLHCEECQPFPCLCGGDVQELDASEYCGGCRAGLMPCARCARANAADVVEALSSGGSRLRAQLRSMVQASLQDEPERCVSLPRPPGLCPCRCCNCPLM